MDAPAFRAGTPALTGGQRQTAICAFGLFLKLRTLGCVLILVPVCPAASCGTVCVTPATRSCDSTATGRPGAEPWCTFSARSLLSRLFLMNGAVGRAGPRWVAPSRPCVRGQPVAAHGAGTRPSGLALLAPPAPPQGRLSAETLSARGWGSADGRWSQESASPEDRRRPASVSLRSPRDPVPRVHGERLLRPVSTSAEGEPGRVQRPAPLQGSVRSHSENRRLTGGSAWLSSPWLPHF